MDVDQYRERVIALFKSGTATDTQWEEMSHAVLHASEDSSDEATPKIDAAIFDNDGNLSATTQPETGWLLERKIVPEGQEYLTVEGGCFSWTTDNLQALRLSRREDADSLAEIVEDCERVAEHQWGG